MNLLQAFYFDALSQPYVLLLLIVVLVLLVLELLAKAPGAIQFSTGDRLAKIYGKRRHWRGCIAPLLRTIGLSALIVALAGPLHGYQIRRDRANIIDIMLVVDVSSSMQERDFLEGDIYRDRLYITKREVQRFIEGRRSRTSERFGLDRIGLINYAGFAWTQCPLTLDYEVLLRELDRTEIMRDRRRDGTAIGSALGLAVQRLNKSEAESKVVILLTDGLNNRGELDPISAAHIAAEFGIRIYTIGVGATQSSVQSMGFLNRPIETIDEDMLTEIAEIGSGRYYHASDTEGLQRAYEEIGRLETTEVDIGDYYEFRIAFMPYLILGSISLAASIFSRRYWFESIP